MSWLLGSFPWSFWSLLWQMSMPVVASPACPGPERQNCLKLTFKGDCHVNLGSLSSSHHEWIFQSLRTSCITYMRGKQYFKIYKDCIWAIKWNNANWKKKKEAGPSPWEARNHSKLRNKFTERTMSNLRGLFKIKRKYWTAISWVTAKQNLWERGV